MSSLPFIVELYGRFGPGAVRVIWKDEPISPHPELAALVERCWSEQMAEARQRGAVLFNGKLVRHLRHRVADGVLEIEVGHTDYAHFMATNYLNPHLAEEWGAEQISNPIGTSATVITRDGWLLYGRRSEKVICNAGDVHTFGGAIEQKERQPDGQFDVFDSIRRELEEELGIRREDVTELTCLGIIEDGQLLQPELIFDAKINLRRHDLEDRLDPNDPEEEHAAILSCMDRPEAIIPFFQSLRAVAPISLGAACLHGRHVYGEAWYREVIEQLRGMS